jgi:Ser/Thr protein kinase RdoA (MazF antagonist)
MTVADRVAELEEYVPHTVPRPGDHAHRRLFAAMAGIHSALQDEHVTRPVVSTYGPPGTLRRHLTLLERRPLTPPARHDLRRVAALVHRLERVWVPARQLPSAVVHGDARLENLPTGMNGQSVVLDLGFAAKRPRIHDLAHATAWILLGPADAGPGGPLDGHPTRRCVDAYEEAAGQPLARVERLAFDAYLAGVCLYQSAVAAHVPDPDTHLARPGVRAMVEIVHQVLERPGMFT